MAILTLLDKNPGSRTTAINDKTGIPIKSIERYLSDLKRCGLIVYKGSSSSGGYYIVHDKK
ncbi:MAG: winged helix-turn-helix transcriptional regulator [Bacteroidales bacterium]|nr:winged helix-turn-helix transcriptional regulator [Bacteroidales bacterium]